MAAPRKTASSRPRSVRAVSDTPADVTINLDTLEREHGPAAPFVAYLGGKRLVFEDPQEIPWQDLLHLDDPEEFARLCLPEGQREHFLKHKVEAWKMNALMRGFKEHYGMGSLGNDDA